MTDHFRLVIDQGNSYTKIGVFQEGHLIMEERLTDDQVADSLRNTRQYGRCKSAILSSVRKDYSSLLPLIPENDRFVRFSPSTPVPINVLYETPQTLGSDRVSNAVAAAREFPNQNVLIVDCGTCFTYTLVQNNALVGGAISPGLFMRLKALHEYTGRLPLLEPADAGEIAFLGVSTNGSILAGALHGSIAEVDGMITQYCSQIKDLNVILTGGDTAFFDTRLKNRIFAKPYLTLYGLHDILEYNGA